MTRHVRDVFVVVFVLLEVGAVGRTSALSWDGYYKNYFVVDNLPEAVHLRMGLQQSWIGAVSQRVRMNAIHRFDDRLALNVSYDLVARVQDPALFGDRVFSGIQNAIAYRAADLDLLLFPRDEADVRSFALIQNLDRLVFTVTVPLFDLYMGRQAVAWGSARTVNPTDVIAPFSYTDLDTEDRIGVDALRLRAPLGDLGELDLGYVAGKDFAFSESSVFLRGKTYLAKTDFTGLIVGFREHLMIGADITRAIGGAGSWFEVAYVFANVLNDLRSGSEADYLRLSIGADHSLGERTYGYLEYHFNEAGTDCPEDYGNLAGTPAYTDGAVYLLGEHYLATGISYQASPLVTVFGNVLANLTDPSGLLVPVVEYNFREDVYLEFGAYIGAGDSPVYVTASPEFVDMGGQFQSHSEFGAYPDMYYASFRVYF